MLKKILTFTCLTLSVSANAAIVTINYSGTISSLNNVTTLDVGDRISGFFRYDDQSPYSEWYQEEWSDTARITYDNSISEFYVDLGVASGYVTGDTTNKITVGKKVTAYGTDYFSTSLTNEAANSALFLEDRPFVYVNSYLENYGRTALPFSSLPNSLSVTDFTYFYDMVFGFGDDPRYFPSLKVTLDCYGTNSCASVSPVPIPATAWLFGSALFGLVAVKRRKA